MPRLSIDLTPEQHMAIKARALLAGKSIKDFMLDLMEQQSLKAGGEYPDAGPLPHETGTDWEADLRRRIDQAVSGTFVDFDPEDIMRRAMERREHNPS